VSRNCSASRRGLGRAGIAVSRLTTASHAAICTTVAVTTAYEEDLVSDGYVNNSTSVCCWRPDVSASFHTLRAELTARSDLSPRAGGHGAATTAACGDS
jgi:hypothetical protein